MSGDWRAYESPDEPVPPVPPVAQPRPYGDQRRFRVYHPTRERWRLRRRVATFATGVVVVIGGVGVGGWAVTTAVADLISGPDAPAAPPAAVDRAGDRTDELPPQIDYSGGPSMDMFSDASTTALTAAIREATGSILALEVTFFREQTLVKVPGPTEDSTPHMYVWTGELTLFSTDTTVHRRPFDLRRLSGAAVGSLCGPDRAECVAEVRKPFDSEGNTWMEVTDMESLSTRTGDLRGRPSE